MKGLTRVSTYLAAFASGYVGALLPILAMGQIPAGKALVAALAAGLVATGLFHCPGPGALREPSGR